MDYYSVLGVRRDCTKNELKQSYRKHALQSHPDKHDDCDKSQAAAKFQRVAEAYHVLSNPRSKAIFDRHGAAGLQKGVPGMEDWSLTVNADDIFVEFFGTNSPFAEMASEMSIARKSGASAPEKPNSIQNNLYCSLEELYLGATKKIKIIRQTLDQDGETAFPEERVVTVEVKPGWRSGTKIKFDGEGDQKPKGQDGTPAIQQRGDVVFTLKEKPHPHFSRRKHDLIFRASISLREALTGTTVDVPMLDGRVLPVAVSDIVSPGFEKSISGEGMPISKSPNARGYLVLAFDIQFPDFISVDQKSALERCLP